MNRKFLVVASALGALAVGLGAFAAHALKSSFSAEALAIFETGVRYQFYHVFALLAVGLLSLHIPGNQMLAWSGNAFIAGIVLFSGSLYLLATLKSTGAANLGAVGIVTPIGGLFLIAGWLFLLAACFQKK